MRKLGFFCATMLAYPALADRFDITTTIGEIRYHESENTLANTWQSHVWFGLASPDSTPDCPKYGSQYVIAIPSGNDEALSIILAAKLAEKQVVVTIDDSVKYPNGQYCKLQYITLK